ncbi:hypothetical protein ACFLX9_03845 [Chloroflexota bacterium]
MEPESPCVFCVSSDTRGDRSKCQVCKGLAEAREIHRRYVTLPPETVEAEELLGKPLYIPEKPVKVEKGEQVVMESLAPPPAIEGKAEATMGAKDLAVLEAARCPSCRKVVG